ncbi:MAG TPA: methylated-DNA--[protein]-cysteine S-methyltransferase [Gemmatimonadales bacterium]|nr:methylated-DNA--[protein]-cysteine S-methyltransferase [Gemmatimonadales bacterium]
MPMSDLTDFDRVARAIRWLDEHPGAELGEVARAMGLSPFHFQRLFTRWAGVSPKRFEQFRAVVTARNLLRGGASVLAASWDSGLSGPGRLHDLMVAVDAVTPGEYKAMGEGLELRWGVHEGPFGPFLLAESERGVSALRFLAGPARTAVTELREEWPAARLVEDRLGTARTAQRIFQGRGERPVRLFLKGTNWQLKVWEALLRIPAGATTTYGDIAAEVRAPAAARAVGAAVGANPVHYLIPCHRVILSSGAFGGYAGGPARKRALLGWEAVRAAS